MTPFRLWDELQLQSIPVESVELTGDGQLIVSLDARLFDDPETAEIALELARAIIVVIETDDGSTVRAGRLSGRTICDGNGPGRHARLRYAPVE